MSTVFVGSYFNSLKKTIDKIVDDPRDNLESSSVMKQLFEESAMEDAFIDDLETSGPGYVQEKPEGEALSMGTLKEGYRTRYLARTYALGLAITEELMEDEKYDEAIAAARRLKVAAWKTIDYDATNVFIRGFSSSYVGGDGLSLWNASHTIPNGSTFSNTMATPLAPSVAALQVARAQIRKFPGHDGLPNNSYRMEKITFPVDQEEAWEVITGSVKKPDAGEFNAINVFASMKLKLIPNVFWSSTTTNWAIITNADNGFKWKWRRRMRSKSWVNNEQDIMKYAVDYRSVRLWSDPRCTLGVNA